MKRTAAVAALLLLYGSLAPVEAAMLRPIDKDGLNLRSGPGTQYAVVGGLSQDQSATVLGKEGDWYRIRLASGTEGWVAGWYSRILLDDEQRYAAVNTDVLNVRREPHLDAPILARLVQDQPVRLLEMIPEWWRVRLDDGTEGWVASAYMKQLTTAPGTTAPGTTTPGTTTPGTGGGSLPVLVVPPTVPYGTVPDLPLQPPRTVAVLPGKTVQVVTETGVYAGPNSEARRVDTVLPGETLRLLDAGGGWVRAETPRGKWGWVHGSLVRVLDGRFKLALSERTWVLEASPAAVPATAPLTSTTDTSSTATIHTVQDPNGLALRLTPYTAARQLAVLPRGEQVEVLETKGGWVKVKTSSGLVGWAQGAGLSGGAPAQATDPAPAADPSQAPSTLPMVAGEGFKVIMDQPSADISRLVVETAGKMVGQPVRQGSTLTIPFPTGETQERSLPLNILGVKQASITPTGLRLELEGEPSVKVEEAAPGRLALTLRPVLRSVTTETVDGKGVFRLNLSGHTQPVARDSGGDIIVEIPGALLSGPIHVQGGRVEQLATGVRITIPSYRTYALKRSAQGFYLVVYPPGLAGKAILLDPGHGGDDAGAVSRLVGVVEKEINLELSLRVRALLEEKGAKVYMTRASDRRAAPTTFLTSGSGEPRDQLDMLYRTMLANEMKTDLFLSIHHNSGEPGLRGTETFYTSSTLNGGRSRTAARLIQQELINSLGTINRGAKDDTYFVTRNTDAPAVLVEVGFVNDPVEGPRTKDPAFQQEAARAIVRALEQLYAERPR